MRFDDTLETVLASDLSTPLGMQSVWRQLVDLIGRRRAPADSRALAVLRSIRSDVPPPVRAASARGLELADPPAALVRLFARDEFAVAAPVLRTARLTSAEWIALLPELAPTSRAVLRHRRDLSPAVKRALESFGPVDFVLPAAAEPVREPAFAEAAGLEPLQPMEADSMEFVPLETPEIVAETEKIASTWPESVADTKTSVDSVVEPAIPELEARSFAGVTESPFSAAVHFDADPAAGGYAPIVETVDTSDLAATAAESELPTGPIAEDFSYVALAGFASVLPQASETSDSRDATADQSGTGDTLYSHQPVDASESDAQIPAPERDAWVEEMALLEAETGYAPEAAAPFAMSATPVVTAGAMPDEASAEPEGEGPFQIADVVARIDAFWRKQAEVADALAQPAPRADAFRFETDACGMVRWVDGVSRAPLIGLSLDLAGMPGASRVDGIAAGAFRRRAGFSNARLLIEGDSDAAGDWLISGIPVFDSGNGRFSGYRGTARRPRADERADRPRPTPQPDSLRQLVHELRTPTNAIAGFAEMIETQMLGPVAEPYRERAGVIRGQARELLGAIDDLDLAARIESDALSLVAGRVSLRQVLAAIADDLAPLLALRGSWIALPIEDLAVACDRRAVERLLSRLLATLVSASAAGERVGVRTAVEKDDIVAITIDRPRALADFAGDDIMGIDDEAGDVTLLGTGFALRLARNLAKELGGSLVIEAESLTLRLPAAGTQSVEQAI